MPWGISHSYGKPPFKMNKSSMGDLQDPKMEVPTVYKADFSGLCKGISPQNMARNMLLAYLHFRILKISH
jgi:heterodisulfide reductase subunit B